MDVLGINARKNRLMFERIVIKNFQVHESKVLDLDPYVTVIVGPNDAGKSAILRALRWVALNDPTSGDTRWGAKFSKVVLTVDGKTIIRKRTKKGNIYLIGDKEFKAFRTEVPAEIRKLLNIDEINFQQQLDPHFWLSLPAPKVSREMNQIVNLGIIDRSLANIGKMERKARTTLDVIQDRLDDARKQKKSLNWVLDAHVQLEELEDKQALLDGKQSRADALESLVGQVAAAKSLQRRLAQASVEGQFLLSSSQKLLETTQQADLLESLIRATIKARQIKKITIPDISVFEKYQTLESLINQIEEGESKCHLMQTKLRKISSVLKRQRTCPVCGTPLSHSQSQTSTCPTNHQ